MFQVCKTFKFEAAHRLVGHKGKCRWLHGHSYQALIVAESDSLDDMEMVIDFSELNTVKTWIDANLDHNTILWKEDRAIGLMLQTDEPSRMPFYCEKNPTAEHIAKVIFDVADKLVKDYDSHLKVVRVTVFETQTSCATYVPEPKSEGK